MLLLFVNLFLSFSFWNGTNHALSYGHIDKKERESELTKHTLSTIRQQLVSRDQALRDSTRQLTELQSSTALSDLEQKLRTKTNHADSLELELSKARTSLTKFKVEKETSEVQLSKARELLEGLEEELREVEERNGEKSVEEIGLKKEFEKVTSAKNELENWLDSTTVDLDEARAELETTKEELLLVKNRLVTTEESLAQSRKSEQLAISRKDDLQIENSSMLESLEELRSKIVSLSNDNVKLTDELYSTRRSLNEAESKLSNLQDLESKLSSLEENNATLAHYELLSSELQSSLSTSLQQISLLEDQLAHSLKDSGIASASLHDLTTKVTLLESQLVEKDKLVGEFKKDAEIARQDCEALEGYHDADRIAWEAELDKLRNSTGAALDEVTENLISNLREELGLAKAALGDVKKNLEEESKKVLEGEKVKRELEKKVEKLVKITQKMEEEVRVKGSLVAGLREELSVCFRLSLFDRRDFLTTNLLYIYCTGEFSRIWFLTTISRRKSPRFD